MADVLAANFEFLQFGAEISNPGTGEISPEALGERLGFPKLVLMKDLLASRFDTWASFAGEILEVLDSVQRETGCLDADIEWYTTSRHFAGGVTPHDEVRSGS